MASRSAAAPSRIEMRDRLAAQHDFVLQQGCATPIGTATVALTQRRKMRPSLGRGSIGVAAWEVTMDLPIKLSHLPGRIVAGAFILNSGLNKRHADEDTVAGLHGMATGTYRFLGRIPAPLFVKLL